MDRFIVGEVSKNWPSPDPARPICTLFEGLINTNLARGYRLHSFTLHRLMTGEHLNETIIAVFERQESPIG